MQIIINAGGAGTRLWPISTVDKPKQFTAILDEQTLLEQTWNRMIQLTDISNIWISTNQKYLDIIQEILPGVDKNRIILEPQRRDTFGSICASSAVVASWTSPNETIIHIQSDAYLPNSDTDKYIQGLKAIDDAIASSQFPMITVGVKPSFANTGLGYVNVNSPLINQSSTNILKVIKFTEKPDLATAQEFVKSGNYLWHWGTFSFSYNQLRKIVEQYQPSSVNIIDKIYQDKTIKQEVYAQFEKIAFEYAIVENLDNLGILSLDVAWDDLGTWKTVYNYLPDLDSDLNQIQLKGSGNKFKSSNLAGSKKVAFVGVSNLIVVETDEGLLILDPQYHPSVKQVAEFFTAK